MVNQRDAQPKNHHQRVQEGLVLLPPTSSTVHHTCREGRMRQRQQQQQLSQHSQHSRDTRAKRAEDLLWEQQQILLR